MAQIWQQTFTYLIIMALGYFFKKISLLKASDSNILSTIIINLTLPCMFFSSALGLSINPLLLLLMVIGLLANILMLIIAHIFIKKESSLLQGVYLISASGYDIGNFVLPFVITFFPGLGVIYLSSFNVSNILMSLGLTYAIASNVANARNEFQLTYFLKKLISSISLDAYLLVVILAIFKLELPTFITNITATIGNVNPFLVMFMIGLKLDFSFNHDNLFMIGKILSLRFISAIILTIITIFLPLPTLAKTILYQAYFAPLVSVSSILTKKLGYDGSVVAEATSISIIISLIISSIILSIIS